MQSTVPLLIALVLMLMMLLVYLFTAARSLVPVCGRLAQRMLADVRRGRGDADADADAAAEVNAEVAKVLATKRVECARMFVAALWTTQALQITQAALDVWSNDIPSPITVYVQCMLMIFLTAAGTFSRSIVREHLLIPLHCFGMVFLCFMSFASLPASWESVAFALMMMWSFLCGGLCLHFPTLFVSNTVLLACRVAGLLVVGHEHYRPPLRRSIVAEVALWMTRLCLFYGADVACRNSARKEVEIRHGKCQRSAVSSLLNMMCDAVVDLDHDWRMKANYPKLAGILMRGTCRSLCGTQLADLVLEGEDRGRLEAELSRTDSEDGEAPSSGMLTVRMRDSISNLVTMVCFHVPYFTVGGQLHHLIGIREDADIGGVGEQVGAVSANFRAIPEAVLRPHIAHAVGSSRSATGRRSSSHGAGSHRSSNSNGSGSLRHRHAPSPTQAPVEEKEAEALDPEMTIAVELLPGLPICWAADGARSELGLKDGKLCPLGNFLADNGRALLEDLNTLRAKRQARFQDGGFSVVYKSMFFGDAGGDCAVFGDRRLWVYFPPPPDSGRSYYVSIGLGRVVAAGEDSAHRSVAAARPRFSL